MVVTLALRATQEGDVIWARRPLVSTKGLLSRVQNLPLSSHDKKPTRFRAVAFNASGELLAATDERGRVFVFFVTLNRYALVQHLGVPTVSCCFSPARKTELLVTCEDETVRCIDVQAQTLISTLRGHRFPARCASFQRSGQLALTASQDAVILWDTKDWSRYRVLNAGPGVEEATFVRRGDLVAVCFQDDTIMMWELESLALRYRFSLPEREQSPGLQKIAVSEDEQVLVASGRAPFIYVWEFESQTIIRIIELPPPIKQVTSHAFLPGHSTTISILGDDGSIFFLDVAAKNPQIKLEISNNGRAISAFDIEYHARYLAAATSDGFLLLYDMEIARETAARAQERRRKEGLMDLGGHARLRTRSGLQGMPFSDDDIDPTAEPNPVEFNQADQSHPVPSKLIDSLFGAKLPKHAGRASQQTQQVTTTSGESKPFRMRPASATRSRVRATTGSLSVPTKDMLNCESTTLRDKVRTRQRNPLGRPPAQLTAQEIEINRKRLVGSLKCSGMYPKKYRVLVWRFLLHLPKNEEAFRSLVAKGKHPVFVQLKDQYPLQDNRTFRRLHRILSAVVYWCPAFGEVSYLPAVVYPFVKIFRENDLAAFEASISVMLHWCGDFLISLPYPPVFAMSAIEKELARRDAQLYDHFTRYQVTSEAFAWSLLKTIFTEVLSEDEWMCLWDHLFTCSDTPQLLLVAVLAYLSYFRTALLASCDRFSIEQFFHQQNAIDIQKFVQLMMNLRAKLDLSEYTAIEGPAAADTSRHDRGPYWPLSRGQYPAFAHYPRFVVDFQISERNRIALEEAELVHKQKLLDDIEEDSRKLKTEHEKWMKERKLILEAEERRRKEAIAAEKERILHLKTLDYETRKRRLQHLSTMEASAHETLEEASKMLQTEYQRVETTLAMQTKRVEFEISSRKQEEDLQRVEFETHDRVNRIHKQREMEERLSLLRSEFETRLKQQELQDLLKFESWKREDEEETREARTHVRRREARALLSQEKRVRQELENRLLEQQLARDKELLGLETARRARRQEQQGHYEVDHETDAHFPVREHAARSSANTLGLEATDPLRDSGELASSEAGSPAGALEQLQDQDEAAFTPRSAPNPHEVQDSERFHVGDEFTSRFERQFSHEQEPSSAARAAVEPDGHETSHGYETSGRVEAAVRERLIEDSDSDSEASSPRSSRNSHEVQDFERYHVDKLTPRFERKFSHEQEPSSTARATVEPDGYETSKGYETSRRAEASTAVRERLIEDPNSYEVQDSERFHVDDEFTSRFERQFSHEQEPSSAARAAVEPDGHETSHGYETSGRVEAAVRERLIEDSESDSEASSPRSSRNSHEVQDFERYHVDKLTPRFERQFSHEQEPSSTARATVEPDGHETSKVYEASERAEAAVHERLIEDSDSDSEGYDSSAMMDALQRPIAELEKKLGIRFDDFSDEEKEDEYSFDVRQDSDEEDDETIEDDRTKLLQRAKRLLELSSFDTDSDDDL
ncbi:hypothetical protein PF008_g6919 [Phytophthora fragariae]|uniref:TBC1 domain family member 31 n=1 Tax=Phytophthora fragariae TaxID=53985 RepID=A0A6G0S4N8_9STRA|nr:hypothetical protein PF008_g6919 [Phytophthora fragariae]